MMKCGKSWSGMHCKILLKQLFVRFAGGQICLCNLMANKRDEEVVMSSSILVGSFIASVAKMF